MAQGMYRKSTFDDVLAEVEREQLFKVKLPDRTAKIIMESPAIAMLEDDEAGAQQRRINEEEAKQAAIKRAAHESGAPVALLRALEHRRTRRRLLPSPSAWTRPRRRSTWPSRGTGTC